MDDIIIKKHTSTFVNTDIIPPYFKIAKVQAIDAKEKEIKLIIDPSVIPTLQCGDGCAVNKKGAAEVEKLIGLPSPFSRCASHISHGESTFTLHFVKASSISNKQIPNKLNGTFIILSIILLFLCLYTI